MNAPAQGPDSILTANKLSRQHNGSLISTDAPVAASRYQRLSSKASKPNENDLRTETEKDRGRLTYSPYLRRLSGVTQVVSPSLTLSHLHTRESHSRKVALVSREIAEELSRRAIIDNSVAAAIASYGGLDIPACETAGLAHDIGHPPFGHSGEVALNRELRRRKVPDGFEGNAQSLRIVARLDTRKVDTQVQGLDLTAVTLAAILKYPFGCPMSNLVGRSKAAAAERKPPKFGYYDSDKAIFDAVASRVQVEKFNGVRRQTLEASIMDLADDITYAVHDLEDVYRENAVDFDLVNRDIDRACEFLARHPVGEISKDETNPFLLLASDIGGRPYFDKDLYDGALRDTSTVIEKADFVSRYDGSRQSLVTAASVLSLQIEKLFKGLAISATPPWPGGPGVYLKPEPWHLMQCLKAITRQYVVATARVGMIETAQQTVIASLFTRLSDWLDSEPRMNTLPHPLADFLLSTGVTGQRMPKPDATHFRAISDYICTMSDQECLMRARWLNGFEVPEFATSH